MQKSKICNKCNKRKKLDKFVVRADMADGTLNTCKKCMNESLKQFRESKPGYMTKYNQAYYEAHKDSPKYLKKRKATAKKYWQRSDVQEKDRARKANRHQEIKLEVIQAYGGECYCCGETMIQGLTLDHINGDGAEHRRSISPSNSRSVNMWSWVKRNGFPKTLRIACSTCNLASFHNGGICPHNQMEREEYYGFESL